MITVLNDFNKRVAEIEVYFKLVENIIQKNAQLHFPTKKRGKTIDFDEELIKILKANCFLLLYNLIESSIKQSIAEIYDTISTKNVQYKHTIDEIKKIWITEKYKNFRNQGASVIFDQIDKIAKDIISIQFDTERTIPGNIDGRKIREFAEKYGFSEKVHHRANEGIKLHQVKIERNKLAHGIESFAQCGRRFGFGELTLAKNEVTIYLRGILKNIQKYLDSEKFKK